MENQTIIVGIDFGTTYSGVAWTTQGCPEDLEVISEWPGSLNKTLDKVPTVMAYVTKEKRAFRWGFQVSPLTTNIHGLKLLLDDSQENRYGPSIDSRAVLQILRKTPVEVASDYLRELFQVVRRVQVRRLGEAYVSAANFRVILTVPAVWSDKAKDVTLQAAQRAGLDEHELSMISEPEAAALYTLQAIQPNTITGGDTFVVCDAGGGTVDLITYQVRCAEPLDLDEVVQGDGGICGSTMLDKRFEKFMENRIGAEWSQLSRKGKQATLDNWAKNIKCNFSGIGGDDEDLLEFLVVVPGVSNNESIGIEDGMMLIESTDIAEIFEPIIQDVERLLRAQIDQAQDLGYIVKAILLVGGFGSSAYLYKRLRATFPLLPLCSLQMRGLQLSGERCLVEHLRMSLAAVKLVAIMVLPLLWPLILQNIPLTCKNWDPTEEEWRASNRMSWFVSKLLDEEKISLDFYRTASTNNPNLEFKDNLLCCNDVKAPEDGASPAIFTVCTLAADLRKVPRDLFTIKRVQKGKLIISSGIS